VALVFRIADYPVTRRELVRRLCRDLCGLSCFSSVYDVVAGKHRQLALSPAAPASAQQKWLVRTAIAGSHGLLLGTLCLTGHPLLYAGLWLLPAVTLLQLFARIRAITEHAGYPEAGDQMSNARTVVRRSWQTFLFGPHCIHYHIEHHCHPRAPFYRLPKVHQAMLPVLPPANLYRGYGRVLRDVSTRTG
jgi:fatty acid desaturase